MIVTETATVYRAGGRRYFTKRAAVHALVRAKLKEKCACDYVDHEGYGREDLPCSLHASTRYETIMRRLARIYMNAMKGSAAATQQETKNG